MLSHFRSDSRNTWSIRFSLSSLLVLLPLEIFLPYDDLPSRLALALTNVVTIGIILFLRRRLGQHHVTLPGAVVLLFVLDIWFDAFGNFLDFYTKIPNWDRLAHFLGTAVVTLGILATLQMLRQHGKIQLGGLFITIVAPSIALSITVIHEIVEFIGDRYFGTHRITSLFDTSGDLLFNLLGAGLVILLIQPYRRMKITSE